MMEQGGDMIIEEEVLRIFDALDRSKKNPRGFLHVLHGLYPNYVGDLATEARSWEQVENAIRSMSLPSTANIELNNFEERVNLSMCLLSAIGIIRSTKRKRDHIKKHGHSLCRYCWRIGVQSGDRRGYHERKANRRRATHAYCGLHRPRAEIIISEVEGSDQKIYRKVHNQKDLQKARKVARLADRIERWVIQRDARLSRSHNTVRSWVAGDSIVAKNLKLWPQFVALFFPYIAHSPEWDNACMSPIEAFMLLERDNEYEGKEVFNVSVRSNPGMLASYIMPMMLRLDVCLEVELMIANRRRDRKKTGFIRYSWPDASML